MNKGIYPATMDALANLLSEFDQNRVIMELSDAGLALEELRITDAEGDAYIGFINWDEDGHPVFYPFD